VGNFVKEQQNSIEQNSLPKNDHVEIVNFTDQQDN
jgi:hypothetical protein